MTIVDPFGRLGAVTLAAALAVLSGCQKSDHADGNGSTGGGAGVAPTTGGGDAGGALTGGSQPTGGNAAGGAAGEGAGAAGEGAGATGATAGSGGSAGGDAGRGGAAGATRGGMDAGGTTSTGGAQDAGGGGNDAGGAGGGSGGSGGSSGGEAGAPSQAGAGGVGGAGGAEPVMEVECGVLAPVTGSLCEAVPGSDSLLLQGTVLGPDRLYRGGSVAIDADGVITCVGCDCVASGATVVRCPQGVISPGLINLHDHLTHTQNSPFSDTGERYEHRHDWRRGNDGHTAISATSGASEDERIWGELRFLLGGATAIAGGASSPGLLRNLDRREDTLGATAVELETFPLGDADGTELVSGCRYPSLVTGSELTGFTSYLAHVGEGIDAAAHNELTCLSQPPNDLLLPQTALVHGVALEAADLGRMATSGTALVWSPRSNVALYGNTAPVTAAARLGVQIALGTDWIVSGSANLLRELRCADGLNRDYFAGYFSDRELWEMVTTNAALVAGVTARVGVLAPGRLADIAVFDGAENTDYRAVVAAGTSDVALVLRGGSALYGESSLSAALDPGGACDALDVCGGGRFVCLGDTGRSYAELASNAGSAYGAVFCSTPPNEPSCTPSRSTSVDDSTTYDGVPTAGDGDGDGVADALDDCPTVFNPVRPMDRGQQADADGDGLGDACDPCPLNAGTSDCSRPDPADGDADGVLDALDVCPGTPDPDQTDSDQDGTGDACDACPLEPNPPGVACPVTIYSIQRGEQPTGSRVRVLDVLVTARSADGFFVQTKESDPGYDGADFSGIYVFAPGHGVQVGDRVDLTGATVNDFFGRTELTEVSIVVTASGETSPLPVVVSAADVGTGGSRAAALEGVLVEVVDVTVTDVDPTPGPGDVLPINEFVVDGALRVDDAFYLATPFPSVDDAFVAVRGVLDFSHDDSKLEPRSAGDLLVAGAGALLINEIDYDQPGADTAEFVEILNAGHGAVVLEGYELVLVNGSSGAIYDTVDLSAHETLNAGQYLVVSAATVTVPPDALRLDFGTPDNHLQNGAPDGLALVDSLAGAVVDRLSYEGPITAVVLPGVGTVSLVEGTVLTDVDSSSEVASLCRLPNGARTGDHETDWVVCSTPTPGAANQL